jgi:hypothetical protein
MNMASSAAKPVLWVISTGEAQLQDAIRTVRNAAFADEGLLLVRLSPL